MCPIQKIFRQQEVDGLAAAKMLMKNVKNGLEFNCYHLRPLPFFLLLLLLFFTMSFVTLLPSCSDKLARCIVCSPPACL